MIKKQVNRKTTRKTLLIVILGIIVVSYIIFSKSNTYIDFYCRFDDLFNSDVAYERPVPIILYFDNQVILDTVITTPTLLPDLIISRQKKGFQSVKVSVYNNPPIDLDKSFFFLNLHYYSIEIFHDQRVEGRNYLKWQPYE